MSIPACCPWLECSDTTGMFEAGYSSLVLLAGSMRKPWAKYKSAHKHVLMLGQTKIRCSCSQNSMHVLLAAML